MQPQPQQMDNIHLPRLRYSGHELRHRAIGAHRLHMCHRNRSDSLLLPFCSCIHSFARTCAEGGSLARTVRDSGSEETNDKDRDCDSQLVSFLYSAPAFPSLSTGLCPCFLFLFLLALPSRCILFVRPPSLVARCSSPLCAMIRSSKNDMISPRLSPVARNQIWREFLEKERMHGGLRTDFSISPATARQSQ